MVFPRFNVPRSFQMPAEKPILVESIRSTFVSPAINEALLGELVK